MPAIVAKGLSADPFAGLLGGHLCDLPDMAGQLKARTTGFSLLYWPPLQTCPGGLCNKGLMGRWPKVQGVGTAIVGLRTKTRVSLHGSQGETTQGWTQEAPTGSSPCQSPFNMVSEPRLKVPNPTQPYPPLETQIPAQIQHRWIPPDPLHSLLPPRLLPSTTVLRHPEFQSSVRTADASGGRRCSQDSTSAFPRLPLLCPLGRSGCMGQRSLGDGGGLQGAGRGQWHWDTPPPTDFPCPYNSPVSRAPPKP